jgi:ABC-type antimicrobial peptide transport system permease subunit
MTAYARFRTQFFMIFGAGSLLLVAVGLYGVVAQIVTQRIPELALRHAIGASGARLAWLVVRQGGTSVVLGVALGAAASAMGTRMIAIFLYDTKPTDAKTLGLAVVALIVSAGLAILIPTARAVRVDPMAALRQE